MAIWWKRCCNRYSQFRRWSPPGTPDGNGEPGWKQQHMGLGLNRFQRSRATQPNTPWSEVAPPSQPKINRTSAFQPARLGGIDWSQCCRWKSMAWSAWWIESFGSPGSFRKSLYIRPWVERVCNTVCRERISWDLLFGWGTFSKSSTSVIYRFLFPQWLNHIQGHPYLLQLLHHNLTLKYY